jgi:hypothetical protein
VLEGERRWLTMLNFTKLDSCVSEDSCPTVTRKFAGTDEMRRPRAF